MTSGQLVVLAKAPRSGAVKTRLSPPFTLDEAAELYACMLDDVLELSARAAPPLGLEPVLAVDPPSARGALAARAPSPFRVIAQRGPDLAHRMANAMDEAGAAGASPILLRGSDSPALDADTLAAAVDALATADVVVCPDRDGGYNVVGVRRPVPGLFAHAMSTASVLRDTLARARAASLECAVLEPGFDIDVAADLRWLAAARAGCPVPPCPRTLDLLDRRNLWRYAREASSPTG